MEKVNSHPTTKKDEPPTGSSKTFENNLAQLPEKKADLIDGVVVKHTPIGFPHDELRRFLETILHLYIQEKKLGKLLFMNFQKMARIGILLDLEDILSILIIPRNIINGQVYLQRT